MICYFFFYSVLSANIFVFEKSNLVALSKEKDCIGQTTYNVIFSNDGEADEICLNDQPDYFLENCLSALNTLENETHKSLVRSRKLMCLTFLGFVFSIMVLAELALRQNMSQIPYVVCCNVILLASFFIYFFFMKSESYCCNNIKNTVLELQSMNRLK